ncbi:dynactin subunit 4-like [Sycon ciliatum]|uniref:dynactin subunit 4-like n=1 Tax=Sycon ciliatum TaxID=27933 RepID=UPI0031F632CD
MAAPLQPAGGHAEPTVSFACSCATNAPLTHLFLCQHCIKLRCARCVSHEIESYYCPYCLETMSSAEAKVKKNRCGNCCDCPCCGHTLSVMTSSQQQADADASASSATSTGTSPGQGKKVYYLRCSVCRWSSRDIDCADKDSAGGGYPIEESPAADSVKKLIDVYLRIANTEKAERDQKTASRRRSLMTYTASLDQRLMAMRTSTPQSRLSVLPSVDSGVAAPVGSTDTVREELAKVASVATSDIEPLPQSYYNDPLRLDTVATLEQRLSDTSFQSPCASVRTAELEGTCMAGQRRLVPQHKFLCTRRLQRCKQCEHILNKPDNNPSSIKTRLQLIALHYMPNFRIAVLPEFKCQQWSKAVLTIVNPLNDNVAFTLSNLPEADASEEPSITADIELPTSQLTVLARDDTSEYDDTDAEQFQDDASVVHRRKANRLSFYVKIRPMKAVGPVQVSFLLCFKYTSAVQKGSQPVHLRQRVNLDLGKMKELHTVTKSS